MHSLPLFVASMLLLASVVQPTFAEAPLSGTLKKIKDRGAITVGHRESAIPFSYYDEKQQVVGYSHDLTQHIVQVIRKKLELPELKMHLHSVTSQNRMLLITNGSIDLECGSTTHNQIREKQVAFSNTFFITRTRMLTAKDSGIHDFIDLKGRNVITTAGTTSERMIKAMNEKDKMDMQLITAKDHGEAFIMLQSDRTAAFVMDDVLLYGERAKAKQVDNWEIVGTTLSREAYACMLPKDDEAYKALVDETIREYILSGEAEKLYQKWFMQPIPPKGINLEYPLTEDMRELFKNPNDQPLN